MRTLYLSDLALWPNDVQPLELFFVVGKGKGHIEKSIRNNFKIVQEFPSVHNNKYLYDKEGHHLFPAIVQYIGTKQ